MTYMTYVACDAADTDNAKSRKWTERNERSTPAIAAATAQHLTCWWSCYLEMMTVTFVTQWTLVTRLSCIV